MENKELSLRFSLPSSVLLALSLLGGAGYEGFLVGGAVRDLLLGKEPHDYDMTTSATPEEMRKVFRDFRTVGTGIAHGTLTVLIEGHALEITTYRVDGTYTDARHPDAVRFTRSLYEDLARRDFTIGAMAYHPEYGLFDPYGGEGDLREGVLRAVGEPTRRFSEDALRILRGLRFASRFGFTIEEATACGMHALKESLARIAKERVREELVGLLCGAHAETVLRAHHAILEVVLPELTPTVGFAQKNPHHDYDVFEHTLHALSACPPDPVLRLAVLFHDLGKPACFFTDGDGVGHFYGHAQRSAEIADGVMRRLRFDNETRERVTLLVLKHDTPPAPETRQFRRMRSRYGDRFLLDFLAVVRADRTGQRAQLSAERERELESYEAAAEELVKTEERLSLKTLAVGGDDLIALGYARGKAIGEMLSRLLDEVLGGRLENTKEAIMAYLGEKTQIPIECERKFLIRMPDVAELCRLGAEKSEITQTYLDAPEGVTRRVRCRTFAKKTVYTQTTKRRLTAESAEEDEREITKKEYEALAKEKKAGTVPITKTRYTLPYEGHLLEFDVYPFWEKQAVLEIELEDEDTPYAIPDFVTVLREVTADYAYKNARLAQQVPQEEA